MRGKMVEGLRRDRLKLKQARQMKISEVKDERPRSCSRARTRTTRGVSARRARSATSRPRSCAPPFLDTAEDRRRPRHQAGPSIVGEAASCARQGSALFHRGETQALVVATLWHRQGEQIIDASRAKYREALMMNTNASYGSRSAPTGLARPSRDRNGKLSSVRCRPMLRARTSSVHDPHRALRSPRATVVVDGLG